MSANKRKALQDLSTLEILIVTSVRAIGEDLHTLERLEQEFVSLMGRRNGQSAFFELCRTAKFLKRNGRRSWRFGQVENRSFTEPERGVLTMIAAHQAGQHDHAMGIAHWFCTSVIQDEVHKVMHSFAMRLARTNLRIPLHLPATPTHVEQPLYTSIWALKRQTQGANSDVC